MHFPVFFDVIKNEIYFEDCLPNLIKIIPYQRVGVIGRWTWSMARMKKDKDKLLVKFTSGEYKLYKKEYIQDTKKKIPFSIVGSSVGRTEVGTLELKSLGLSFPYPKSTKFLKWIISRHVNKNGIILDFFAGSGTTGHAAMDLNKDDGGKRRFILVTNNENGIGKTVAWERLNRLITLQNIPETYLGQTFVGESVTTFEINKYSCKLSSDTSEIERIAAESFSKIDDSYNKQQQLDILYDLKSLHPLDCNVGKK